MAHTDKCRTPGRVRQAGTHNGLLAGPCRGMGHQLPSPRGTNIDERGGEAHETYPHSAGASATHMYWLKLHTRERTQVRCTRRRRSRDCSEGRSRARGWFRHETTDKQPIPPGTAGALAWRDGACIHAPDVVIQVAAGVLGCQHLERGASRRHLAGGMTAWRCWPSSGSWPVAGPGARLLRARLRRCAHEDTHVHWGTTPKAPASCTCGGGSNTNSRVVLSGRDLSGQNTHIVRRQLPDNCRDARVVWCATHALS